MMSSARAERSKARSPISDTGTAPSLWVAITNHCPERGTSGWTFHRPAHVRDRIEWRHDAALEVVQRIGLQVKKKRTVADRAVDPKPRHQNWRYLASGSRVFRYFVFSADRLGVFDTPEPFCSLRMASARPSSAAFVTSSFISRACATNRASRAMEADVRFLETCGMIWLQPCVGARIDQANVGEKPIRRPS